MYNLEFEFIVKGCFFLYDVWYSFGCGDFFCVSCYLFGDIDGIVWDLGDFDFSWFYNICGYVNFFMCMNVLWVYYLLKGFMLIQFLCGMEF